MRNHCRLLTILLVSILGIASLSIAAGELPADEHTLLLLHCNGSMTGAAGEAPKVGSGLTYADGVLGQAVVLGAGSQLAYAPAGNLDEHQGTLEFWLKPEWSGNDGQGHIILQLGTWGGMLFGKDGGNFWRMILNRWASGGKPEMGCGLYVSDWTAGQWHHAAFTWDEQSLRVYVDGVLRASAPAAFPPPTISADRFYLGSSEGSETIGAAVDEVRISDVARTGEEIAADYLKGLTLTGLSVQPSSIDLLETWWVFPKFTATSDMGPVAIPASEAEWSSTDPAVAYADATGKIIALREGAATLTATVEGLMAQIAVNVSAPVLPPQAEPIAPYLANPAEGRLLTVPVVVLRYLPTRDGATVDPDETGWSSTLADLKERIERFTVQTKFMLEEGSRFRGYGTRSPAPSVGYRVIGIVTVYEEFQRGHEVPWNPGHYFPDYNQVLSRIDTRRFVEDLGVREFWIWGYHHDDLEQPESNMSSPLTGDISNSSRFEDDLPVFSKTYTVYGYNFTRTACESVHNHGHQLEAILSYAAQRQDGNADLFWKRFVGQDPGGAFVTGRCGWTHMPPNTTEHYNYWSEDLADSDIEDWTPERTGQTKPVSAATWAGLPYAWPDGVVPDDKTQAQWYLYWMQSMPGHGNAIAHGGGRMTDWWTFTGDWDAAIGGGLGLYGTGCWLACEADGPSDGRAGQALQFEGRAAPSNCDAAPSWAWDFGDGTSSTQQGPAHAYAAGGTFAWTVTVASGGATCSKSGTVIIFAPSLPGDCDGSGAVSIGEVQKAINMFLGIQAPACGVDCSGDGSVGIGEVQKVINGFLGTATSC